MTAALSNTGNLSSDSVDALSVLVDFVLPRCTRPEDFAMRARALLPHWFVRCQGGVVELQSTAWSPVYLTVL